VKLPPVTQAEFEAAAQRSEKNGLRRTVVDLVGTARVLSTFSAQ
jgi:hypothetical protein